MFGSSRALLAALMEARCVKMQAGAKWDFEVCVCNTFLSAKSSVFLFVASLEHNSVKAETIATWMLLTTE